MAQTWELNLGQLCHTYAYIYGVAALPLSQFGLQTAVLSKSYSDQLSFKFLLACYWEADSTSEIQIV